jgi:crotonobetainyl-CoA:carnitine CoA-transferase CaiB-like acyl-CoA transferase
MTTEKGTSVKRLSGIRVLEIGEMVGVPYAAKLLADLGAEVIKIEPPGGDRARKVGPFPPHARGDIEQSGLFLGLNANKKSVVLSLDDEADRDTLAGLVAEADIVFRDLSAERAAAVGLDGELLLRRHPSLVVCSLTPFGHSGPQAEWLGEEINVVHGGGWGWLIPGDAADLSAPPLTVSGYTAHCQAATAAALAALGHHFKAIETGIGECIDVSTMAQVAAMVGEPFMSWTHLHNLVGRSGRRRVNPWGIYQCSDGLVFLAVVEPDQWERFVDMMGRPEWTRRDEFATNESRTANCEELNALIEEWTRHHTVNELFHDGQQRRICFAPVSTMDDLAASAHLSERGFFHEVDHPVAGSLTYLGAPYKMTPQAWRLETAAPLLGEHNGQGFSPRSDRSKAVAASAATPARPLEGLRVVDFTWVWAGPFATMHLAALGAEVIKIESSARPDLGRRMHYHPQGIEPSLNTCGYFNQWGQGKKSVELDLKDPAAMESLMRLLSTADVVAENYATGVMERLGLSDEVLREVNPDLIVASISGFGHTGPMREYMGYGAATGPLAGLTSMTGHPDGRPEQDGLAIGDPAAGISAAFAIVAALVMRQRGDAAPRIDVSLWEATAVNVVDAWMGHQLGSPAPRPNGNRHPVYAPHGVYRCAGADQWVSIACTSDSQWRALAALIDKALPDDARFATGESRKANEAALDELVSGFTASLDAWQVTRLLQRAGVAAYPSLDCAQLESNEQLVAREFWENFDHPEAGRRNFCGIAWRTLRAPSGLTSRAPLLGEHTEEIIGAC